jgi:hypothetical protein
VKRSDGSRSTVERAIEIARIGTATSIPEIRAQLREEHYENVETETSGLTIKEQLKKLIAGRQERGVRVT